MPGSALEVIDSSRSVCLSSRHLNLFNSNDGSSSVALGRNRSSPGTLEHINIIANIRSEEAQSKKSGIYSDVGRNSPTNSFGRNSISPVTLGGIIIGNNKVKSKKSSKTKWDNEDHPAPLDTRDEDAVDDPTRDQKETTRTPTDTEPSEGGRKVQPVLNADDSMIAGNTTVSKLVSESKKSPAKVKFSCDAANNYYGAMKIARGTKRIVVGRSSKVSSKASTSKATMTVSATTKNIACRATTGGIAKGSLLVSKKPPLPNIASVDQQLLAEKGQDTLKSPNGAAMVVAEEEEDKKTLQGDLKKEEDKETEAAVLSTAQLIDTHLDILRNDSTFSHSSIFTEYNDLPLLLPEILSCDKDSKSTIANDVTKKEGNEKVNMGQGKISKKKNAVNGQVTKEGDKGNKSTITDDVTKKEGSGKEKVNKGQGKISKKKNAGKAQVSKEGSREAPVEEYIMTCCGLVSVFERWEDKMAYHRALSRTAVLKAEMEMMKVELELKKIELESWRVDDDINHMMDRSR